MANASDPFKIQILGPGDEKYFRQLMQVFADVFEEQDTYQGRAPSATYVQNLLNKDHIFFYVATVKEKLVGGLAAYVLEKFEQERKEIYIYDLGVDENYRRRGIARALIESLKVKAKEIGAWVIYVQADQGDEPAICLYESLGIREEVLHFDIPVK